MVSAVRGAVMAENNEASIRDAVTELLSELLQRNGIEEPDIISILFSQTKDIDAMNPATALRTAGFASVPLFCTQEPDIVGAPSGIIRVLLTCSTERISLTPVYLNGAERLRRDLFGSAAQE
ncbi:MAG TPA: chorismate mutase [Spirochaetia bacterium]|nr:chorismate mutase [Spirochaetia bacterium]